MFAGSHRATEHESGAMTAFTGLHECLSFSLSLSLSLSVCVCVCVCVCVRVCVFVCVCGCVVVPSGAICMFVYRCLPEKLMASDYNSEFISLFGFLSFCFHSLSSFLFLPLSSPLSVYLSLSPLSVSLSPSCPPLFLSLSLSLSLPPLSPSLSLRDPL